MQSGVEIENLEEGSRDVGYIENGDYISFKDVDFRNGAEAMEFRLATPYGGSSIEIRLDAPDGERIGVAEVGETAAGMSSKTSPRPWHRRPASMTCTWSSRAARAICSTSCRGSWSSRPAPRSA